MKLKVGDLEENCGKILILSFKCNDSTQFLSTSSLADD